MAWPRMISASSNSRKATTRPTSTGAMWRPELARHASGKMRAGAARPIAPVEGVGRVVAFLLSDEAEIIRGQAINVDGGETPY